MSIQKRQTPEIVLFNAKGATGVSQPINVADFRHIIVSIATDGGGDANLTCKFQGSIADTAPDFSAAQTAANHWDYVQSKDLEDASTLDGDTGFAVAGADDYRLWEINTNGLQWFSARITARSQGELTVKAKLFRD